VGPRKVRRGEQGCDGRGVGDVKYSRRTLRTGGAGGCTEVRAGRGVERRGQIYAADVGHMRGQDESGVGDGEQLQRCCVRCSWCASYSRCAKPVAAHG
jgi:hypothetical protein